MKLVSLLVVILIFVGFEWGDCRVKVEKRPNGNVDRKVFELKFVVPAGESICFSHDINSGETLSFNYAVIQSIPGRVLGIDFKLLDETEGRLMIDIPNKDSMTLEQLIGDDRILSLCFSNALGFNNYPKVILLYMHSYKFHNWDEAAIEFSKLDIVAEVFKQSFDNTQGRIEEATIQILLSRLHSMQDLALLEYQLGFVNFWSCIHCLTIGIVGILQVLFVKTLFSQNDYRQFLM